MMVYFDPTNLTNVVFQCTHFLKIFVSILCVFIAEMLQNAYCIACLY